MVVVRIKQLNEYWRAVNIESIQTMLSAFSINTGQLLSYEIVDTVPDGFTRVHIDTVSGVECWKPSSPEALTNAQHQKQFRDRKKQTHRLLRAWVPIDKYEQAKEYCRNL